MKRIMIKVAVVFLFGAGSVHAGILAGWDGTADTLTVYSNIAYEAASGIVAYQIWGAGESFLDAGAGSDDLSYGTLAGARESTDTLSGCLLCKVNGASMDFTLTNQGTQDYRLDSFHMDAWRSWAGHISNYTVSVVSGALSVGEIASGTFVVQSSNPQDVSSPDYEDVDMPLDGLADRILEAGASVTFRLQLEDARPTATQVYLDNIAVSGGLATEDEVIAGWDGTEETLTVYSNAAYEAAVGIVAYEIWGAGESFQDAGTGSDDLTYGTFPGARESVDALSGSLLCKVNGAFLDFTLVNQSSQGYRLETFHMDAWRAWAGQISNYTVSVVSGALSVGVIASGTFVVQSANPQDVANPDFEDIDIPLNGLADRILEAGASVTFRLRLEDSRPTATQVYLDNIAISGGIASDYFEIRISTAGSDPVVGWSGSAGNVYTVQRRESLLSGAWSNVVEGISGSGELAVTNDSGLSSAFYRVIAE